MGAGHYNGIVYTSGDGTLTGTIDVSVVQSKIVVSWMTNDYSDETRMAIWTHSKKIVTSLVDLIAFRMGAAATIIMDRFQVDGGEIEELAFVEPKVSAISNLLNNDNGLLAVFSLMADEQHLMVVMEDLIAGLWSQDHKILNCARSVEAIRQLVAGYSLDPKAQWPIFNDHLNIDRSYSTLIMRNSLDPRHGKASSPSVQDVDTIMVRTWLIIDRFFHYRIGGSLKLDETKFPILFG